MESSLWKKIQKEIAVWRAAVMPGLTVIGIVTIARLTGTMQLLEWVAFDSLLRLRPSEPVDERIVIVGINEEDLQSLETFPIPDREIAALLRTLQKYQPKVIALDLVRNVPIEPGHEELSAVFKENKNLIGIEKVLPNEFNPPPDLPPEQVGFADAITDTDGRVRRILLGTPTEKGYKFSLSVRLAEAYLSSKGITLNNGILDPQTMKFGSIELPRFLTNSGGYIGADAGGVQVLLNYRSGRERFRIISLKEIKTEKFDFNWLRDRIVLIGMTAPSANDIFNTSAIDSFKPSPGSIYGVEIQAHAVSQILSGVMDGRPLLKVWSDKWEYIWILCWGFLGIIFGRLTHSPWMNFALVSISSIILMGISFLFLNWGWWIPLVPPLLVLVINGIGFSAFYQYDRALRSRINIQQSTIERTFEDIHNGPLQTLKSLMREIQDRNLPQEQLLVKLETLDQDLRKLYEFLQQETFTSENSILLGNGFRLDLNLPLHELLYQVYRHTLERNFPCFKTIKITVPKFEPVDYPYLTIEQKRGICRFLEEALCNVGKYATGVTRLKVTFSQQEGSLLVRVEDNGQGMSSSSEGQGTKQAKNLARKLRGKFQRSPLSPKGTRCELTWPMRKFWG